MRSDRIGSTVSQCLLDPRDAGLELVDEQACDALEGCLVAEVGEEAADVVTSIADAAATASRPLSTASTANASMAS